VGSNAEREPQDKQTATPLEHVHRHHEAERGYQAVTI
jgi:hypothetical protein